MNRSQRRAKNKNTNPVSFVQMTKQELSNRMENAMLENNHRIINAILLAMNIELGVGSTRGARVIQKANELIMTKTPEEIEIEVKEKMM